MAQRILMNLDQLDTVKNIPFFSGLAAEEKNDLLKGGGIYLYPAKHHLFRQGNPVKFLYIVCSGIVQECRETCDGHEVTANIYTVGDVFCKTSMFLKDCIHQTNAIAVSDVDVMELPIEKFKENLLKYESVATQLFSSLAQFAFMKQVEVEQQATMTAAQLVADFLKQMCSSYGLDPRGFTLPYKKSLIASRLGMELETLSRALPKLREYGITVKGSHVSFVQPQMQHANVVRFPLMTKNTRRPVYASM
jgi:CRP-like cAMP-binding protein